MTVGRGGRVHWTGLDGLRGLAALAVVLFHAQFGFAVNGFVGVDVFFALSGFLITSILLAELGERGRLRLGRFYVRRLLRLYPALVATCAVVVVAGVAVGNVSESGAGALAALSYMANWWMYTGRPAPLLEHTWTLAIEEHFYAIWPVLLAALSGRRRWVRLTAVVLAVAVLVLVFVPWPESIADVRGTYLRGFPIIWGSLLAWLLRPARLTKPVPGLAALGSVAYVALVVVLLMPWSLPERWLTGPGSVTGVLSVLVLASIVQAPSRMTARTLSWEPLRWAGSRSYGIYLYHFPILQVLRHHSAIGPEWARMVAGVVACLVVAELSFRLLESPFLRLKGRIASRSESAPRAGRSNETDGRSGILN